MICIDSLQAQLFEEESCKSYVPETWGLIETVQCFLEFIYYLLVCFSLYVFKHLNVNKLGNEPIEKSCFDIQLVNVKVEEGRYCEKDLKGHRFYYGGKGLIKVNFKLLEVAFNYPLSFKVSVITIYITFQFIYLFSSQQLVNWVYVVFMIKVPDFVPSELIKLFFYCFCPLSRVKALHCTSVSLKFFNIKLGKENKLNLISGICQIDSGCQNFQKVFMPWLFFFNLFQIDADLFIVFILSL